MNLWIPQNVVINSLQSVICDKPLLGKIWERHVILSKHKLTTNSKFLNRPIPKRNTTNLINNNKRQCKVCRIWISKLSETHEETTTHGSKVKEGNNQNPFVLLAYSTLKFKPVSSKPQNINANHSLFCKLKLISKLWLL